MTQNIKFRINEQGDGPVSKMLEDLSSILQNPYMQCWCGGGGVERNLLAGQPKLVGELHNSETLSQRRWMGVLRMMPEVVFWPAHRCIYTHTCTPHVQTHMYAYI